MLKILFATAIGHTKSYDYLTDGIFHGFKSRPDQFDVYECFAMKHLYKNYSNENDRGLFGKRNLEGSPKELDLSTCIKMIEDKFFDIIVFDWRTTSNFWSHKGLTPYLKETMSIKNRAFSVYPKEKIVFLDGADDNTGKHDMFVTDFLGKSTYFKRELYIDDPYFHPIDFSFQKEQSKALILSDEKEKLLAHVIPDDKATYIFDDELSYFGDYSKSYFGATWRKLGWCCNRHCEIMFSSCVPLFPDIKECPPRTMTFFPKKLFEEVIDRGVLNNKIIKVQKYWDLYTYENIEINRFAIDKSWYDDILEKIYNHAHTNLTTVAMANYVLSKLKI